jgi:integrase
MQNVDQHPKTGIYRVRVTYPEHLRPVLKATGITRSLKTRDAVVARKSAIPVLAVIHRRIEDAETIYRTEPAGRVAETHLMLDAGIRLVEEWRDAYLRRAADVLAKWEGQAGDYLVLADTPAQEAKVLRDDPLLLVSLYYSGQPVPADVLTRTLDRLLFDAGHVLPARHPLRNALTGALRTAIAEIRRREDAWRAGDWCSGSLPPPLATPAPLPPSAPSATPSPAGPISTPNRRTIRLSGLFDAYVERTKPKGTGEQKLAIRQLCNFLGQSDPFAHDITFEQAERFYETLTWLPKAMTLAMAERPLVEIANAMRAGKLDRPRAAGATAAKKVILLSALFNYGVSRGWVPANPFARVAGPRDTKPAVQRHPFSPADLTAIFCAPVFSGCASPYDWRSPGTTLLANHRFWLPLLALVTGARIEELGQLLVSDVMNQDGIVLVHITESVNSGGPITKISKSVKTDKSARRIPVHRIALDAGFEGYWQWLAEMKEPLLFPELAKGQKRTKEASRWFNRDFRRLVGIDRPELVFHSFRHLFKDICRTAKLRRDLHDALTGHVDASAGAKYGMGLALDDLKEGIDALTFRGFPGVPARVGQFALISGIGAVVR